MSTDSQFPGAKEPAAQGPAAPPEGQGWRARFGPDEVIQRIRPQESDRYLANPHRGTTTFQRFNGDDLYPGLSWNDSEGPVEFKPSTANLTNPRYPDTTISYCRWLWSVIEPEKGTFRWDIIDGALKAARDHGQTLQMRIQPFIGNSTPDWYWALGAAVDGKASRRRQKEPDHNDPLYLKHWGDIIRAFGERYDGHPDLESFDLAYGGSCGEMGGNATPETGARLADVYLESFKKTTLVSMLNTPGGTYAMKEHPSVGWRADCYGDVHTEGRGAVPDGLCWNHMYDEYPKSIWKCGAADRWRTAPVTLETCWTVGYWYKNGWDLDWIIDQGYKYHLSVFMPKSSFIPEAWTEKVDAFNKRMGYRFVLRQMTLPLDAKPGAEMPVEVWIDNVGVAPIYRPYKLAFRFSQGKRREIVQLAADVRTWMPDNTWFAEEMTLPPSLERGEAKVDVAIVDPATNAPRVAFAIEETADDGWHPMTSIDVV
jgi:hypothetical protein